MNSDLSNNLVRLAAPVLEMYSSNAVGVSGGRVDSRTALNGALRTVLEAMTAIAAGEERSGELLTGARALLPLLDGQAVVLRDLRIGEGAPNHARTVRTICRTVIADADHPKVPAGA